MDREDNDEESEEKQNEALILADIQTLACRVSKMGGREGGRQGDMEEASETLPRRSDKLPCSFRSNTI